MSSSNQIQSIWVRHSEGLSFRTYTIPNGRDGNGKWESHHRQSQFRRPLTGLPPFPWGCHPSRAWSWSPCHRPTFIPSGISIPSAVFTTIHPCDQQHTDTALVNPILRATNWMMGFINRGKASPTATGLPPSSDGERGEPQNTMVHWPTPTHANFYVEVERLVVVNTIRPTKLNGTSLFPCNALRFRNRKKLP